TSGYTLGYTRKASRGIAQDLLVFHIDWALTLAEDRVGRLVAETDREPVSGSGCRLLVRLVGALVEVMSPRSWLRTANRTGWGNPGGGVVVGPVGEEGPAAAVVRASRFRGPRRAVAAGGPAPGGPPRPQAAG